MPGGTYSRRHPVKRGSKKSSRKKVLSRYGKAAKSRRALATAVKRTKRVAPAVKKAVVSNTKAIQSLKDKSFGTWQTNSSIQGGDHEIICSDKRPCILHLNNLHSTGTQAPPWIRPNQQIFGAIQNTMDDYTMHNNWRRPVQYMRGIDALETQNEPQGEQLLWKSTRLDFVFTGWIEHCYIDITIVQERVKNTYVDPWRNGMQGDTVHGHHLPYTLPMWRESAGPYRENKIDWKKYKCLKKKRIYINSIGHTVHHHIAEQTTQRAVDFAEHATGHADGNEATVVAKAPTTDEKLHCSLTIHPNKILKRLYNSSHLLGFEPESIPANANESKTGRPYDYDNFRPSDNIWCIVTSTDTGDYQLHSDHRSTFQVTRTNTWRDQTENQRHVGTGTAGAQSVQVDPFNYATGLTSPSVPTAGIAIPTAGIPIPMAGIPIP